MELRFVDTENVFVYHPSLKKVKFALVRYVRGSVAPRAVGIFIVQIELSSHFDAVALERLIRDCWAKIEWGYGRILVRDGANAGWIDYML